MGAVKPYAVVWSALAMDQMAKIDPTVRRRISAKVDHAATNPARFAMRLVGSPHYRLRVGDWRVILSIDHGTITVIVLEVKPRRTAYR